MSAPLHSPAELALSTVLHQAASGASTTALLDLIATQTRRTMGTDTTCAVVLSDAGTSLTVHARTTTGATPAVSEHLLLTGPVHTTATTGAVSTIDDTRIPHLRWPAWATTARDTGILGVRCWPVQVGPRLVGALVAVAASSWSAAPGSDELTSPGPSSGRSSNAGQAMAYACSVVLQLPVPAGRWEQAQRHLHTAVTNDVVVHQAVGMIAAAHDSDIPTAATALATHAQHLRVDAATLARRVVTRDVAAHDIPVR